jgi:uncharacterized protein YqgV (UPF0045/DUF77 family)
MNDKCKICGGTHDKPTASDREETRQLDKAANSVLLALIHNGHGPADVMYVVTTIAAMITAMDHDGKSTIDERINTFKTVFEGMTRERAEAVEKIEKILGELEKTVSFIMQPTDGSIN